MNSEHTPEPSDAGNLYDDLINAFLCVKRVAWRRTLTIFNDFTTFVLASPCHHER
jgi:hypothetical protein